MRQLRRPGYRWLLILLLSLWLSAAAQAQPRVYVEATPRELGADQTLRLSLTVVQEVAPAEQHLLMESPNLALPPLDSFELLSQETSSATVGTQNKLRLMVQAVYQLRPRALGQVEIPSLTLQYRQQGQTGELVTEAIPILVQPPTGGFQLPGLLLPALLFVFLLIAPLSALLIWRWRRRRAATVPAFANALKARATPQIGRDAERPVRPSEAEPRPSQASQDPVDALQHDLDTGRQSSLQVVEAAQALFYQTAAQRQWLPSAGASKAEILQHLQARQDPGLDKIGSFLKHSEQLRYSGIAPHPEAVHQLLQLLQKILG
ncbi:MAG: BatD family protein [Candidatus Sericytochromatia bacterium]|nr:BatD family protein [Candidatus Sericytochromatia bacterium]